MKVKRGSLRLKHNVQAIETALASRVWGEAIVLLMSTRTVPAQSAPVSPDHPWHTSAELKIEADARKIPDLRFNIDSTRTYALAELIDLAEAHNPATRVDWERARVQAGALGITRSELFPTLASAAVSQTSRQQTFFGRSLLRPGNPELPG